ncbi:hypothetical protein B4N84_06560 [Flavobacterium sp. IR1]|nr:hypothetical protein B4N84_06560 [Flavobacterium sp. IR1]
MFKLLTKDIAKLFVSPNEIKHSSFSKNFKEVLFYYFIFTIFLLFITVILALLGHLSGNSPRLLENTEIKFLDVAIIAPILEETLFRLVMRWSKFNLLIFFVWLFIFILYQKFLIGTACLGTLCILFFLLFSSKKFNEAVNRDQLEFKFFPLSFLIYLSCFLFGIMHVSNFETIDLLNISVILYLSSHILGGFVFALLRLKFGIISSIFYHSLINSIAYFLVS